MDLSEKNRRTLLQIAADLKEKKISAVELAKECFSKLDERDNTVKAFLSVDRDAVLAAAEEADKRRASGNALSDYDGIPVGIKDNIAVRGETLSCASKLLKPVVSPYDATAVSRLRAKGFIPFGRLNMDEFAMGSFGKNSAYGPTDNPAAPGHAPGGSSSGSAAAVAGGMADPGWFQYYPDYDYNLEFFVFDGPAYAVGDSAAASFHFVSTLPAGKRTNGKTPMEFLKGNMFYSPWDEEGQFYHSGAYTPKQEEYNKTHPLWNGDLACSSQQKLDT